jgi:hypothetical protein
MWRAKGVKDWEIIADNLSKAGWTWGCVSAVDSDGRTIWIAEAHRGDGERFVVRADEKLSAFVELESAICIATNWLDKLTGFFSDSTSNGSESGGGLSPARFFISSGPAIRIATERGKERKNHESIDSA